MLARSLLLSLVALLAAPAAASPAPPAQDAKPDAKPDAAAKPDAPPAKPKGLGEAPPAPTDLEWVQGKAISQYKRGDIYLFAFVNTGASATARMLRQLTALQEAHAKDRLQVLAVFVNQSGPIEPPDVYMKRRPEAAKLLVARDKNDATLKAWNSVIGRVGPEAAVLVDRKGRIAWHGLAAGDLDAALAALIADDSAALGKLIDARGVTEASAKTQLEALNKAGRAKQWDKLVTAADALLALDARVYSAYAGNNKYRALVYGGKKDEAAAYGRELVAGALHDDEGSLNEFAWWIVDPEGRLTDSARDNELALSAAERGCELSGNQDAAILDTLARAHWRLGHRDQALELQKKAVGLAFGSDNKALLQKSLDEYLKPPAAKPDVPGGEPGATGAPPPAPPAAPTPPPPGPGDEPKS
jgi:hypothetical protein